MIDDALQEQAALHALGMLGGEELSAFEATCAANPELQSLVESLRHTADGLAHALPPIVPPPSLRAAILHDAAGAPPEDLSTSDNVIPFPAPGKPRSGLKLAVAALLTLIPAGLAVHFAIKAGGEQSGREAAEKKAVSLARERDALQTDKANLIKSRDNANSSYSVAQQTIEQLRAQNTKQAADLAALTGLKKQLEEEVKVLKARQLFDEAQIALLTPTGKSSKAVAVSVWNQKQQDGVFIVKNLPPVNADRNYQLWVFDDKSPVSAGLLTPDGKGGARMEFKAKKQIKTAAGFAVSNETKGEHDSPGIDVVLIGQ